MRVRLALFLSATIVISLPGLGRAQPTSQPTSKISPALQTSLAHAGETDRVTAWVFFADKGHAPALRDIEATLTPHARARRLRNRGANHLVDAYDAPVDARYVDTVRREGLRVRNVSRWLNAVSVQASPRLVEAVAQLPFVRRMDVVRTGTAPLPEPETATPSKTPGAERAALSLNYGASFTQNNLIDVPPLHDQGYSGNGVWICMLDTGFNNLGHVTFQSLDVLITHDFVNGDSVVSDEPGQMGSGNHGTNTLSVIGGYAPGDLIGTAFGATYILAKTENTNWERHVEEDAWVAGAEWADSIGADIISSSLGYSTGFTNGETSYTWNDLDGQTTIVALGAGIAVSRGILVVNSAGNDGFVSLPANTLISPSDGDSVLAVGAVDASGVRATFSSVGPTADGRIKPDLVAMGVSVHVASAFDNTYYNSSGTSFSCPLVAGAAALIMEARPNATNQTIMAALRATASQANAPDRLKGWGIIDAAAAAGMIPTRVDTTPDPSRTMLHPAYPNPFNPNTTIAYEIPTRARVSLVVYDVRGVQVATLVDEVQPAGRRSVVWNATSRTGKPLASGVYLCVLTAGDRRESRKLVLLK